MVQNPQHRTRQKQEECPENAATFKGNKHEIRKERVGPQKDSMNVTSHKCLWLSTLKIIFDNTRERGRLRGWFGWQIPEMEPITFHFSCCSIVRVGKKLVQHPLCKPQEHHWKLHALFSHRLMKMCLRRNQRGKNSEWKKKKKKSQECLSVVKRRVSREYL